MMKKVKKKRIKDYMKRAEYAKKAQMSLVAIVFVETIIGMSCIKNLEK
ncbi:MAG: hypothetical protein ACTSYR_04665 [Candidatus Odinarchaeia archaeon]